MQEIWLIPDGHQPELVEESPATDQVQWWGDEILIVARALNQQGILIGHDRLYDNDVSAHGFILGPLNHQRLEFLHRESGLEQSLGIELSPGASSSEP
jgi:hypothetical protein